MEVSAISRWIYLTNRHAHTRDKVDSDPVEVFAPSISSDVFIVVVIVVSDNFANESFSLDRLFLCTGCCEDLGMFVLSTSILLVVEEPVDGKSSELSPIASRGGWEDISGPACNVSQVCSGQIQLTLRRSTVLNYSQPLSSRC